MRAQDLKPWRCRWLRLRFLTDMERMRELVDKLNDCAYRYYVLDDPVVSDGEYDKLYDELLSLEEKYGMTYPDSPTKKVGGEGLKAFKPYTHKERLYSLDKSQTKEGLYEFNNRLIKNLGFTPELTVEMKFDGLTLSLTYDKGRLIRAVTRGNGEVGEEVTAQVKTIKSIPKTVPYLGLFEAQGEGIMRLSVLKRYNENAGVPLKNARNGAAGAIRNMDPKVTAERNLDICFYNVGYIDNPPFTTQSGMRKFLSDNGFMTEGVFETVDGIDKAIEIVDKIHDMRDELDYLIDGAVIKVNDLRLREELGHTEKFPRFAIAFKYPPEEATTTLLNVDWQVSRTGKLNPLAILEPVNLMGVTVKRATLNNLSDIQKKGIKINARVFVRRSNDVIPEITGVAEYPENAIEIVPPKTCPHCGGDIVQDGVFLYCSNAEECAPRIISSLIHFGEKDAFDIEGFFEKTAEQLYNEFNVDSFDKLFTLTFDDIMKLEGFKDKKASNLLFEIEKSKKITLPRFLYALGIPTVGKKAAKDLADNFRTLDNILSATEEDIMKINAFGDIMAKKIVQYFSDPKNVNVINRLLSLGVTIENKEEIKEGAFINKTVVLTGSLKTYKRSEAAKLIEEQGGIISDTVSKSVNLVVAGEDAGSKLSKAQKLNIEIIGEAQFLALLEEKSNN